MGNQNKLLWLGKPIKEWPSFNRKEVYSFPDRLIKIINSMELPTCFYKNNILMPGTGILKEIKKGKRGQVLIHIETRENEKRRQANETIELDEKTSLGLPTFA